MKHFSNEFQKQADSIRMRAAEKRALKERLVSYMDYHPLPQRRAQTQASHYLQSEPFTIFKFNPFYVRSVVGTLAVVLVVGIPFVAERAVPGDVLYPIKVSFNEEILGTFAGTEYEKIEWETERLSRRIAEARLLASEGRLTEAMEAEVAEAIRSHSNAAQQEIAMLRTRDAEEAAIAEIAFESALDVQSAVLAADKSDAVSTSSHSAIATSNTDGIAGAVAAARSSIVSSPNQVEPSFERLWARIEQETTRASELLASIEDFAAQPEINSIDRRFSDIERKLERAQVVRAEEPELAQQLLKEALSSAQKLTSFMTNIDVRQTVQLEDLIPAELTDEERVAATQQVISKTQDLQRQIRSATNAISNDSVREKVVAGLVQITEQLELAAAAQAEGSFDAAEAYAREALNIAEDNARLLSSASAPEPARGTSTDPAADEDSATTTPETGNGEGPATTTPEETEQATSTRATTTEAE